MLESAGWLLIAAAAVRYWLAYFNRGTNLLDEGSQAAQANRILHGDVIYRDFITAIAPGSYYTVAWLFQLFGRELMVLRWTALVLGILILLATLAAARHIVNWPFAALSALLTTVWGWFLVAPNLYSWEATCLALIALVCYLRHMRTSRSRWIVWSGIAAGATILVKQNTGVYAAVALILTIWLSAIFDETTAARRSGRRSQTTLLFVGGLCLPIVPAFAFLVFEGAGLDLYENLVHYPFAVYAKALALPYPPFSRVDEFGTHIVLYLPLFVYPIALALLVGLIVRWFQTKNVAIAREGHALLAITLFGTFTFLQAWPRADFTHIVFGMQPAYILLGYICFCVWRAFVYLSERLLAKSSAAVLVVLEGVLLLPALLPQAMLLWNGYTRTAAEYLDVGFPLHVERARGILTSAEEATRIDQVTQYITGHTHANEPIFVVPWAAGFYFLTDRRNPTRTDLFFDGDSSGYPCVIAALDQGAPTYVIYGYVWDIDEKHFRDYARPIDEYIRTHYRLEVTFPGYEIWRRVEGQAPTYRSGLSRCRNLTRAS